MTTPSEDEGLLLVAIVQMAAGNAGAGQEYEDFVVARLTQHGGALEWRTRTMDSGTEVHLIRFSSRAGYESFLADPERVARRQQLGDAAPTTKVLEVRDVSRSS